MSQQRDSGYGTYVCNGAITAFTRVKLSGTTARLVEVAGAGEKGIGIAQHDALTTAQVTVKEWGSPGTFKVMINEAIDINDALYGGAVGKFQDTATGDILGYALEAGTLDTGIIEILEAAGYQEAGGAAVASFVDETGGTSGATGNTLGDALAAQTGAAVTGVNDVGGTDGGTVAMTLIPELGGTAASAATVRANVQKLANLANQNQADVASMVTAVNNDLAVLNDKLNALLASLRAAGLLQT